MCSCRLQKYPARWNQSARHSDDSETHLPTEDSFQMPMQYVQYWR